MAGDGDIWVYVEQKNGYPLEVGLELLGEGRRLADKKGVSLAAVFLGEGTEENASLLIECGADRVFLGDSPRLNPYTCEVFAPLICRLVQKYSPSAFLFGATIEGKDLAAAIAARLNLGLTAHVSSFDFNDRGELEQYVPAFGGRLVFKCSREPSLATVAPGVMEKPSPDKGRKGHLEKIELEEVPTPLVKILGFKDKAGEVASLAEAEVIVAGGAGIGNKEGWALLEELARLLGGMVGATRPAVDEGWANPEQMIGQSGKTVRPRLYLAFGISGDQLHVSGVKSPEVFIAVNKDPKAPIFRYAHYGIVSDYRPVLSSLIKTIKLKGASLG